MFDEERAVDTALCALGDILCTLEGEERGRVLIDRLLFSISKI